MPEDALTRRAPTLQPPARSPLLRGRWSVAFAFALLALAAAVLLTGVSVWFLGAVALAGVGPAALTFNFHMPAAIVRLLAITRTGARYGERMAGHQAAIGEQVARRTALFAAMAGSAQSREAGWQLAHDERLGDFMDAVEDVDMARLRVNFPVATLGAGAALLWGATVWLIPSAGLANAVLVAVCVATGLALMRPMATLERRQRAFGRAAAAGYGAALAATVPLTAEGERAGRTAAALAPLIEREHVLASLKRRLAAIESVASLLGPAAAVTTLALAYATGARDQALLVPAFLAFAWLAMGESAAVLAQSALGRVKANAAAAELRAWDGDGSATMSIFAPPPSLSMLKISRLVPTTADGRRLAAPISATVTTTQPLVLVGPSGSGKTTALKQIAGWLPTPSGTVAIDGVPRGDETRRAATHLALHDSAVLTDTVRENLFAPGTDDPSLWDALSAVELDGRVREAGGLDAWIDPHRLSLGEAQRLNLARALLSTAPVVCLDEPGEHLGEGQAARIVPRVVARLADEGRCVVMASHHGYSVAGAREVTVGR